MIFYDADEYWHCEHGFGPLDFDSNGLFFRAIRDVAFVRVVTSGMTGSCLVLDFLVEEGEVQTLPVDFMVDGFPVAFSLRNGESKVEVLIEVRDVPRDIEGGFMLEIRNCHRQAGTSIFAGAEFPSLRLHRIGY